MDVLRIGEGDCNEHTYLFVALARAMGIPARVQVGLAYYEGALYYHAWPAVYVEGWWELDPTFGQPVADATHLALLHGELDRQVELIHVVGKLRVESLEVVQD